MAVDHCICCHISFDEIKRIAESKGITDTEGLRNEGISCTNCKLCVPYLENMFETGKTSFEPHEIHHLTSKA